MQACTAMKRINLSNTIFVIEYFNFSKSSNLKVKPIVFDFLGLTVYS